MIELHLAHIGRHHRRHECLSLLENFRRIDQNFANVWLEQIADCTDDETRFEINEFRRFDVFGGAINGFPQLHQITQIPLQFFGRAADACSARDDAHAFRDIELVQRFTQFCALFTLNTTRNPATARVVRHQHQIATSQRNVGRESRAFVATLVFFNLDE